MCYSLIITHFLTFVNHLNSGFPVARFIIPDPFQAFPSQTLPTFVKSVTSGCLFGSKRKILSTASTMSRCSVEDVAVVRP